MKVSGDFEEFYFPSKAIFAKKTSPRKNGVFFVEQLNRKTTPPKISAAKYQLGIHVCERLRNQP